MSLKGKGGLFSRFGLQIALIAVFGLAALSFFALGALRQKAEPAKPKPALETKLTKRIGVLPGQKLPLPVEPVAAGTRVPEDSPQEEGARPEKPAPDPVVKEKPAPGEDVKAEGPKPEATPAPATADAPAPAPVAETGSPGAPDAAPAKPPFPPPPEEKPKTVMEMVPRPRWQTVGQDWDKVRAGDPVGPGSGDEAGDWKQLDVGESEQTRPKAAVLPRPKPRVPETRPGTEPTPRSAQAVPGAKPDRPDLGKKRPAGAVKRPGTVPRRRMPAKTRTPRLAVINESGRVGQAEIYRDVLTAMGYAVKTSSDRAARPGKTTIMYGDGFGAEAGSLALRIPGDLKLSPLPARGPHDIVILIR